MLSLARRTLPPPVEGASSLVAVTIPVRERERESSPARETVSVARDVYAKSNHADSTTVWMGVAKARGLPPPIRGNRFLPVKHHPSPIKNEMGNQISSILIVPSDGGTPVTSMSSHIFSCCRPVRL